MPFSILDISIIIFCAGGIFLIIIRKIPAAALLNEKKENEKKQTASIMDIMPAIRDRSFFKFKIKIEYRKSIIKFACFLEKILRKIRLNILKIENLFNGWIGILRENTKKNTTNLSIEKKRFFEYKTDKFKEMAQKWQNQAFRIIEEGVEKSLVMMKTEGGKKKKANKIVKTDKVERADKVKNFFEKAQKIRIPKNFQSVPASAAPQILKITEKSAMLEVFEKVNHIKAEKVLKKKPVFENEQVYIERIAKNPRNTEAYRMLGLLYMSQKNYTDAIASFEEIIKKNKNDKDAREMIFKIKEIIKTKNS